MPYWGNIFQEYNNIMTSEKMYYWFHASLCVVVDEGVEMFNYAYMRKTVLDIFPAGQD